MPKTKTKKFAYWRPSSVWTHPVHGVSKKVHPFYFCDYSVKCWPTLMIFGTIAAEKICSQVTTNLAPLFQIVFLLLLHFYLPMAPRLSVTSASNIWVSHCRSWLGQQSHWPPAVCCLRPTDSARVRCRLHAAHARTEDNGRRYLIIACSAFANHTQMHAQITRSQLVPRRARNKAPFTR